MANFASELVNAAQAELVQFGGRKETDPAVRGLLTEYWMDGAGRSQRAAGREIDDRTAWSAAFISFVVKKALAASGSSSSFVFSGRHSDYAGAAILNFLQNRPAPVFVGLPPTDPGAVAPEVGDLIGVTRERPVDDYADALDHARRGEGYISHFDVVTEIRAGKLKCIGGNVSDSVTKSTVNLTGGGTLPVRPFKFNGAGQVISGPYICIIKHKSA